MISIARTPSARDGKYPLEVAEQKAAWAYLGTVNIGTPEQDRVRTLQDFSYMVPNGTQLAGAGKRRAIYMASLKAQGLKPGISDIVIAYPIWSHIAGMCCFPGAYIEMKRVKEAYSGPAAVKAAVRKEQKEWLQLMYSVGYWVAVAYGVEEFKRLVTSYLAGGTVPPLDFLDG